MFDKTNARRAFGLMFNLCIILSLMPVSIGQAPSSIPISARVPLKSTMTTLTTSELAAPLSLPPTDAQHLPSSDISSSRSEESHGEATHGSGVRSPQIVTSQWPITRTEDTSSTIVYSGTWTVVANILSIRASHGDYTWADANGETATFAFIGPWTNLGFVTASDTGQADILIDGVTSA